MTEQPKAEAPKWPPDMQIEFHLKEFEQLKAEIGQLDSAKRNLQIYTFSAVAILISWLAANKAAVDAQARLAWWLPSLVTGLGWLLSQAYVRFSREIGTYIERIEKVAAYEGLGWETHFRPLRSCRPDARDRCESIAWALLGAISVVIGFTYGIPA